MSGIRHGTRFDAVSQETVDDQHAHNDLLHRTLGLSDPDAPVEVELATLERDSSIQVRVNGLDINKIEAYAVIMEEHQGWGPFPPLDVFEDPQTGARRLAGGYHREAAAQYASDRLIAQGRSPITSAPARIHTGDYTAALVFAEDDNLEHGLALSMADKRNIFERRFQRGHAWATASDRSIARELGVDHTTISIWRSSLTGGNPPLRENEGKKSPEKRVGKDGREYRVDRLQKAAQKRVKRQPSTPPSEPAHNLDESEPAGQWQDRPAQPRGLYQPVAPFPIGGEIPEVSHRWSDELYRIEREIYNIFVQLSQERGTQDDTVRLLATAGTRLKRAIELEETKE